MRRYVKETLGGQYKASVRPAVMSKTGQPFLCILSVFFFLKKELLVALFHVPVSPETPRLELCPRVCTRFAVFDDWRSAVRWGTDLSYDRVMTGKDKWLGLELTFFFPSLLFDCSVVKVLFV